MTSWASEELDRIGAAEERELSVLRSDGRLREPVRIGVVRHGDDLCVHSWRGATTLKLAPQDGGSQS